MERLLVTKMGCKRNCDSQYSTTTQSLDLRPILAILLVPNVLKWENHDIDMAVNRATEIINKLYPVWPSTGEIGE